MNKDWKHFLMVYGGGWILMGILHEMGHIIVGGGLISLEYDVGWGFGYYWRNLWIPQFWVNPHIWSIPMWLAGFCFALIIPIYLWHAKEKKAAMILLGFELVWRSLDEIIYVVRMLL